jgi:ribosomal protein S18 acetylase RimI-like enzyme
VPSELIVLEPFGPNSARFFDAVRVYNDTWKWGWEESYSFFSRYALLPDYLGFVALYDGQVAGMTFGARGLPGQWWFDKVAEKVGRDHPALKDAWMLVELAVLEPYRDLGIGTALHNALLAAQHYPRALLSTEVSNTGARRLYERLGWEYLHSGFVFSEGGPAYTIMNKELRAQA